MGDPVGRVSISRCALLLAEAGDRIDRSALSRYCDAHKLKLPKVGREVLVDFEVVQAHRRDNYQREVQSGHAIPATAPPSPSRPAADVQTLDAHRQLKSVELRRKLREEAEEEGRLTAVAEVDAGAADAVVEMRAAFAAARPDLAERLAAELGLAPDKVRILRAGLKRYDRVGQERFAARLAQSLRAANETQGEALDRLTALTAHAIRLRGSRSPAYLQQA